MGGLNARKNTHAVAPLVGLVERRDAMGGGMGGGQGGGVGGAGREREAACFRRDG